MSIIKNIIAGFAGSLALTALNEGLKKSGYDVPRVDLLGEEALNKGLSHFDAEIKSEDALFNTTLVSDLVSNAVYYSLIGSGDKKNILSKTLGLGLLAGVGAITVPKHVGLNPQPVTKNQQVKLLTVGYYLFGAIVTGSILALSNKK